MSEPKLLFLVTIAMVGFTAQGLVQYLDDLYLGESPVPIHLILFWIAASGIVLAAVTNRKQPIPSALMPSRNIMIIGMLVVPIAAYKGIKGMEDLEGMKASVQIVSGLLMFFIGHRYSSFHAARRILLKVIMVIVALSCGLATWERLTGTAMPWAFADLGNMLDKSYGTQGLEWFPVSFGYSVVVIIAIAGQLALGGNLSKNEPSRLLCILTFGIGMIGVICSGSRSTFLGILIGLVACRLLMARTNVLKLGFLAVLLLPLSIVVVEAALKAIGKDLEVLRDARFTSTWLVYLPTIIANPLGIEGGGEWERAQAIANAHQQLGISVGGDVFEAGVAIAPHNCMLTAGMRYGWMGFSGIFGVYWITLVSGAKILARIKHKQSRDFPYAIYAGIVALFTHSMFHNMNLFSGDTRNWLWLGLFWGSLNGVTEKPSGVNVRVSASSKSQQTLRNAILAPG